MPSESYVERVTPSMANLSCLRCTKCVVLRHEVHAQNRNSVFVADVELVFVSLGEWLEPDRKLGDAVADDLCVIPRSNI